ncbi:DUF5362 family protein [Robertkochia solimangrovi]|uniref:DUF5362 family protein n=1 Tax=Robertkochia solimangrovi TaxID=2213046 RepID=UPI00117D49A8|nr:DUF5362 family protein [Robertkochia solimangrovi]TRZ43769.1 hypothetical protein DMZ48_10210 [Robertkochia solimangrovi]
MDNQPNINEGLALTHKSIDFLKEVAKWGKFLAIVGFIGIGLMVILAFFYGAIFAFMPNYDDAMMAAGGSVFTIVYLVLAVIYFFPVYYLFKFSEKLKGALNGNDSMMLQDGFEFLKKQFKYVGILMIVMLSLYGLIFIFSMIFLAGASMM